MLLRCIKTVTWPLLLVAIGCGPRYQNPCSPRPGFDQVLPLHQHPSQGPGVIYVPAPQTRSEVIGSLQATARALREAPDDRPVNVHVDIPLAFLKGFSCEEILAPFERANSCATRPRDAMISFYRLPSNWAGGGRELSLHFDESGHCDGARWCATQ